MSTGLFGGRASYDSYLLNLLLDGLTEPDGGRVEFRIDELARNERGTVTAWRVKVETDNFTVQADAHHPFWALMRALGNLDERLRSEALPAD